MADEQGRVLVVDDNRMSRQKLTIGLRQQGHRVEAVDGGAEALELLARDPAFDAVLLDIVMPGIDGYEVLARLKADPVLRDLPVIVVSALEEIESVVRCLELGAEDYLPKNFDPLILRARLASCRHRKQLRDLERRYLQQEMTLRQSERLATLGKLSAGMAHELNNPAAAAVRGATQIGEIFPALRRASLAMAGLGLSTPDREAIAALADDFTRRQGEHASLDPLARSDREAEVEAWLGDRDVPDPWTHAATFVDAGLTVASLDTWARRLDHGVIGPILAWLGHVGEVAARAAEIAEGAGRIAEIVRALKSYSYMDQAPVQSVDIHQGLDNTLIILRAKLKQGVAVHREYAPDLPEIEAYGGELNQVWTNIIDNAIDALGGRGTIVLRTARDGDWVSVTIADDGRGIPAALLPTIFDPFVTTKPPGQGTGLGLNITHNIVTNRHGGRISVESRPGATSFEVRLPMRLPTKED